MKIDDGTNLEKCLVFTQALFSRLGHLQDIYATGHKFVFALEFDKLCIDAAINAFDLKEILSEKDVKIIEEKVNVSLTEFINRVYGGDSDKK